LDNFDDRYLGAKSSDPGLDNDGNALVLGALYFNSTDGVMKVYTASGWIAASSASVATLATFEFVATSGQTVFSGNDANGVSLSYVAPALIVTLNGVRLRPGDDYTATNGTSITLISAAALNDELVVDAFGSFLVANTYTIAQTDAGFVSKTSATGAATMPVGTTGQRPGTPATGMFRMNSTTGEPEWYNVNAGAWNSFADRTYEIEYVVVAGGGGGGGWVGSGGGGGGYRSSVVSESSGGGSSAEAKLRLTRSTAYTVTVGAGGPGSSIAPGGSATIVGTNGNDSVFGSITSVGGGRGASWVTVGAGAGGSGGGIDYAMTGSRAGTSGQGYQGGIGTASPNYAGGGGGGAGQVGQDAGSVLAGNGGNGVQSSITGTATYRAGGGGGGVNTPVSGSAGGSGGLGGGGAGRQSNGISGTADSGLTNTGGGGGGDGLGGPSSQTTGGNGGSGVVIIRYPGSQQGAGGTVTSSGGYTIHTFTSSGTFTA